MDFYFLGLFYVRFNFILANIIVSKSCLVVKVLLHSTTGTYVQMEQEKKLPIKKSSSDEALYYNKNIHLM